MLHKVYAEAFGIPVDEAIRILYEGFDGSLSAKDNIRVWLQEKIQDCELQMRKGKNFNDEILYLKAFLKQLNDQPQTPLRAHSDFSSSPYHRPSVLKRVLCAHFCAFGINSRAFFYPQSVYLQFFTKNLPMPLQQIFLKTAAAVFIFLMYVSLFCTYLYNNHKSPAQQIDAELDSYYVFIQMLFSLILLLFDSAFSLSYTAYDTKSTCTTKSN